MTCPVCGSFNIQYIRGRAYLRCNECGYIWKNKSGCPTCGRNHDHSNKRH